MCLTPTPVVIPSLVVSFAQTSVPVYGGEHGIDGRLTAWLTCKKWSSRGQLPDSRTITHRERVITSVAALTRRGRRAPAKPLAKGSRSRRLLKHFSLAVSSRASVGDSAGRPSSADVGEVRTTACRNRTRGFSVAAHADEKSGAE